jgi:S1/P1 Nuclease
MRNISIFKAGFLIAVVVAGWMVPPAHAWNKAGHMVTGEIAYQVLKTSQPDVVQEVIRLSASLPSFAKPAPTAAVSASEMTFMYLARWPDDIRSDERLSHPPWHYVDLVYIPGTSEDGSTAAIPEEEHTENIFVAFRGSLATLIDTTARDEDRAIALAWAMHLAGDVHQPLHTTSIRDATHPDGDRGGNSDFIRAKVGAAPINLHAFWDDIVLSSEKPTSVRARAITLWAGAGKSTQAEALDVHTLGDVFEQWARVDSYPLAIQDAYDDGSLTLVASDHKMDAPALSTAYLQRAKADADAAIERAGERLAAVLKAALGTP